MMYLNALNSALIKGEPFLEPTHMMYLNVCTAVNGGGNYDA